MQTLVLVKFICHLVYILNANVCCDFVTSGNENLKKKNYSFIYHLTVVLFSPFFFLKWTAFFATDLDQQSFHSDPEEPYMKDLPEFPSVEEFPSLEPGLLHFPLRLSAPAAAPPLEGSERGEEELLSPASLLIQHLASPLHFVNTHFNGHGRPPVGETVEVDAAATVAQDAQRSLEALSEEIVSTAISTVVQNTLSALLGAGDESSLAEFLPAETPPGPLDPTSTLPAEASPAREDRGDDTMLATADEDKDEEEDFELLDQSELELLDEGRIRSFDEQAVGSATEMSQSSQDRAQS